MAKHEFTDEERARSIAASVAARRTFTTGDPCNECGEPMVTEAERKAGIPGVVHNAKGRCRLCSMKARPSRSNPDLPWKHERRCTECNKTMRTATQPKDSAQAVYGGYGLCHTCLQRQSRAEERLLKALGMI